MPDLEDTMRIHTDTLTGSDILFATREASKLSGAHVAIASSTLHGSRKRNRGIELRLTSDGTLSRRRPMGWNRGERFLDDDYAATWDQWGYVIAYLFSFDPEAIVGPYNGRDDFHKRTGYKFDREF